MDSEGSSSTAGETNLFPIPRIGKMGQNGQEPIKQPGVGVGLADAEGNGRNQDCIEEGNEDGW